MYIYIDIYYIIITVAASTFLFLLLVSPRAGTQQINELVDIAFFLPIYYVAAQTAPYINRYIVTYMCVSVCKCRMGTHRLGTYI